VFPLHNPRVKDIVSVRHGETRRAKLFFLRDRVGKKTRLREVFGDKEEVETGAEADAPKA
jgi:large subunit ribosomal protein L19